MLLDNGQEVRPLLTLPIQGAHPFVNGNSEDGGRESWVPPETPSLPSPQVYMWVGTQTSQVEIKLSLKACQVSGRRGGPRLAPEGWKACPGLTPVLLPGIHPAHACQRARASPPPAPGPQGQRAARLYPMLPRLEHLPKGPGLGQAALPAVLPSQRQALGEGAEGPLSGHLPPAYMEPAEAMCRGSPRSVPPPCPSASGPSSTVQPVPAGVTLAEVHRALGS